MASSFFGGAFGSAISSYAVSRDSLRLFGAIGIGMPLVALDHGICRAA